MPQPAKTSREAILRTALGFYKQQGINTLSMRQLAKELGLSVSSLYYHFPDKHSLEDSMRDVIAIELLECLTLAVHKKEKEEAIKALAQAYLAYSRDHKDLYDLLLAARPAGLAEPGKGKDLWNFILAQLAFINRNPDDTDAAVAIWSFLHGFVSLERSGLFGLSGPQGGFEAGLEALKRGLAQR